MSMEYGIVGELTFLCFVQRVKYCIAEALSYEGGRHYYFVMVRGELVTRNKLVVQMEQPIAPCFI